MCITNKPNYNSCYRRLIELVSRHHYKVGGFKWKTYAIAYRGNVFYDGTNVKCRSIRRPTGERPDLGSRHAEESLIKCLGKKKIKDYNVFVIRIKICRYTGEIFFGNSEPCYYCNDLLKQHGVNSVATLISGSIQLLDLKNRVGKLSSYNRK